MPYVDLYDNYSGSGSNYNNGTSIEEENIKYSVFVIILMVIICIALFAILGSLCFIMYDIINDRRKKQIYRKNQNIINNLNNLNYENNVYDENNPNNEKYNI